MNRQVLFNVLFKLASSSKTAPYSVAVFDICTTLSIYRFALLATNRVLASSQALDILVSVR